MIVSFSNQSSDFSFSFTLIQMINQDTWVQAGIFIFDHHHFSDGLFAFFFSPYHVSNAALIMYHIMIQV